MEAFHVVKQELGESIPKHMNQTDTMLIEEYFFAIGYGSYSKLFIDNGFDSFHSLSTITEKNYESVFTQIGVTLLGHRLGLWKCISEDAESLVDRDFSSITAFNQTFWLHYQNLYEYQEGKQPILAI